MMNLLRDVNLKYCIFYPSNFFLWQIIFYTNENTFNYPVNLV